MPLKLFDKILSLQGYNIKRAKKVYRKLRTDDRRVEAAKREILQHHLSNTPFYKQLVDDQDTDWEDLPVLTKRNLQQPLADRLSEGFTTDDIFKGKTSGSSGHPFTFGKDKFAHALTWAAFHEAYSKHDIDLNTSLQARFYGIPLSGKGRYMELAKDFVSYRKRFPVFNLNDEVLGKYVARFRADGFEYLNGYTSSILLLASYCRKNEIVLKEICPTLKICIVTSEMLFPQDKELMEKWFGVPVINEYGASEVGLIAMEDEKGRFLLNNKNLFIEIVDENNKPVKNGEKGKVLITDLFNLAHPIIRYEIGDVASIAATDDDRLILQDLQGRTNDVAQLPSGKVIPGLTFYYVTKSIISENLDILEFVVIQKDHDIFEIQYVSDKDMDQATRKAVQNAMDEYVEPGLTVMFSRHEQMEP